MNERIDRIEANLQRGWQQRVFNTRRKDRRAPITDFLGDYLKMKREHERSKENDEKKSKRKKECDKEKVSEKESGKKEESEKDEKSEKRKGSENNGEVDSSRKEEIQKENEERKEKEESKEEEKESFCAKQSDVRVAYCSNQPVLVLVNKEACLVTNDLNLSFPSIIVSFPHKIEDKFANDVLSGLPPIKINDH